MLVESFRLRSPAVSWIFQIAAVLGFTALTAVSAKILIPLPFTPVPITLQSFSVILAGILLGSKRGAASQIALIGLGLMGLPVFSVPLPGMMVLMGPTGGYILGFVLAAFVAGWIFEQKVKRSFWAEYSLIFLSSLFIFLPGALWLSQLTGMNFMHALKIGVLPFLLGDLLKCFACLLFMRALRSARS